jgi:16S rRNA (adenine1518-N6/adenine1519-N6)-dimethyltransferase
MNIEQTKQILFENKIALSKSLGQNFLINDEKLKNIVDFAEMGKDDCIIEIGPGIGTLTEKYLSICKEAVIIEIDERIIPALRKCVSSSDNVSIINSDALVIDYKNLIAEYFYKNDISEEACCNELPRAHIKVMSNLPYNITTQMIVKLVTEIPFCERMIFTLQKEAAQKLASPPKNKEYSIMSAFAQYYFTTEIVEEILPANFFPVPNVVSCVVRMVNKMKFEDDKLSSADFLKILKAAFSQRRKTLINSLGGSGVVHGGKSSIEAILKEEGISLNCRAEELTPEQLMSIAVKVFGIAK